MSYRDDIVKIFKALIGRDDVEFELNKKGHIYQVKIKAPLSELNCNMEDLISMGLESIYFQDKAMTIYFRDKDVFIEMVG